MFPTIKTYGTDSNSAKCLMLTFGRLTVWYSYQTVVAFQIEGCDRVVSENLWGNTTGKHLNWISSKKDRVPRQRFEELWRMLVEPLCSH